MAQWKEVVLKTIKENEQSGFGLWIIQTFKDGVHARIQVRCGQTWKDKTTGEKRYPIGGMEPADFDALKPFYPEFLTAYKAPPAMPGATPAAAAQDDIEEVPF